MFTIPIHRAFTMPMGGAVLNPGEALRNRCAPDSWPRDQSAITRDLIVLDRLRGSDKGGIQDSLTSTSPVTSSASSRMPSMEFSWRPGRIEPINFRDRPIFRRSQIAIAI
jgi:hypothetical protein